MPCKDSIPYERSLVAKMEGRPFALLGVNCDPERQTLQQVSLRQDLSWPNWWNGGFQKPLTAAYAVEAFPTTLVLDANGVIRHIHRGKVGSDLEQTIEKLVREAETKKS